MLKGIHIFDLDGTLVDSSHRYRTLNNGQKMTIDLDHWRANEHRFTDDSLLPLAKHFQALNSDPDIYTIWITARTVKHFTESFGWLVENLGEPNKWFCRPNNSDISGAILKANQLKRFLNLQQFRFVPRFFYEDNKTYLKAVCDAIIAQPIFVISNQGH